MIKYKTLVYLFYCHMLKQKIWLQISLHFSKKSPCLCRDLNLGPRTQSRMYICSRPLGYGPLIMPIIASFPIKSNSIGSSWEVCFPVWLDFSALDAKQIAFWYRSFLTQSWSKTPMTSSVHCKFNSFTAAYTRT